MSTGGPSHVRAADGVVLLFGRTPTTDRATFGLVPLRAATESEARAGADRDPVVRARVMRAELFPFRIAGAGPALLEETGLAPGSSLSGAPGPPTP